MSDPNNPYHDMNSALVSFGINMDAKIKQTVTNKLKEFLVEFRPVATFLQGDNSGEC